MGGWGVWGVWVDGVCGVCGEMGCIIPNLKSVATSPNGRDVACKVCTELGLMPIIVKKMTEGYLLLNN
ncbi:MAG: hypothetical protein QNJ74_06435 [Trichodesmium sp. MO_231.B1]|nr:hypothetical protein [Trichodesmium sp. MO_231.B1]